MYPSSQILLAKCVGNHFQPSSTPVSAWAPPRHPVKVSMLPLTQGSRLVFSVVKPTVEPEVSHGTGEL